MPAGDSSSRFSAILRSEDARDWDGGNLGRATTVLQVSKDNPDPGLAKRLAEEELALHGGLSRTLSLTAKPLPFVEVGDSIEVRHAGRSEVVEVRSWNLTIDAAGNVDYSIEAVGWTVTEPARATPLTSVGPLAAEG